MAGLAAGGGGGGVEGQKVCGFFLAHKGRVCRMLVKAGRRYCGQHLTEDTEAQSSGQHKRIPCPLDPKQADRHLTTRDSHRQLPARILSENILVVRAG